MLTSAPPSLSRLNSILSINPATPLQSFVQLARRHGPIFRMGLPGGGATIVSSFELVDELCDLKRFEKNVFPALRYLRPLVGDALFTAFNEEPNWGRAHRILTPAFSAPSMKNYFPPMIEVALELVRKWERLGPQAEIDVAEDMTRLTLDTIAVCGFGYRFDSFNTEQTHPFVVSMLRSLRESFDRVRRFPLQTRLSFLKRRRFDRDAAYMGAVVDEVIARRRKEGQPKKDLLGLMLDGVDQSTQGRLDDTNIRYQVITFLIAGHETTSGLLSFAVYFLLEHPECLVRAVAEVDRVLGKRQDGVPRFEDLAELSYVSAVLKEALRLWPTASMWAVTPFEDTKIGERYPIRKGENVMVLLPMLHRDPAVWGPGADSFNPDNFSPEAQKARPTNAYKPFGNGPRGCIGRHFAMQEAVLALALVLRRFTLSYAHPYRLKVKETLTLKPQGMKIRARARH